MKAREAGAASCNRLPKLLATQVHRLHGSHDQYGEVVERAWAAAIMKLGARLTDPVLIVLQIRDDRAALDLMDGFDELGQVHLDAALLSQRSTGRATAL